MAESKPKRFRLNLVNAAEDVPRLVRAYGRACGGEFALVLRPREERGVLVLITREGASLWRSGDEGDAPGLPAVPVEAAEAVKVVKIEQKALPKAGPITLRGQWSGHLDCDEHAPRVVLRRKLATYGWLHLESEACKGWTWKVERTEKWFSEPGADEGAAPTLLAAIQAGLQGAMGMLSAACSLRDSRRRAAYDPGWAQDHPIRPAREGRDPTERLKVKEPRRRRKKAAEAPASAPAAAGPAPELRVVPLGATPTTVEDLRVLTSGHAQAFEADPKASTAKRWVKGALLHLGLEAVSLSAKTRTFADLGGGQRVFVSVVLPPEVEGDATDAKLRLVSEAAPRGLSIESWDYGAPGARRASRRASAPSAAVEPEADAAKDKALLDAFSAAIAAAMGEVA